MLKEYASRHPLGDRLVGDAHGSTAKSPGRLPYEQLRILNGIDKVQSFNSFQHPQSNNYGLTLHVSRQPAAPVTGMPALRKASFHNAPLRGSWSIYRSRGSVLPPPCACAMPHRQATAE